MTSVLNITQQEPVTLRTRFILLSFSTAAALLVGLPLWENPITRTKLQAWFTQHGGTMHDQSWSQATLHSGQMLIHALLVGMGLLLAAMVLATYLSHRSHQRLDTNRQKTETYPSLEKLNLAGMDALILLGTFLLFAWPIDDNLERWSRIERGTVVGHAVIVTLTIGWFWVVDEHYARRRPFWSELRETLLVLFIMTMVSGAAAFVTAIDPGRFRHLTVWALSFALIPLGRAVWRLVLDDLQLWRRPAVIIGTGENAREAWLALRDEHSMGYHLLAFVQINLPTSSLDTTSASLPTETAQWAAIPPLSTPAPKAQTTAENQNTAQAIEIDGLNHPVRLINNLNEINSQLHENAQIFIALDTLDGTVSKSVLSRILTTRPNAHVIPPLRGLPLLGTQVSHFFSHEVLMLSLRHNLSRRSMRFIKRIFDVIAASFLLLVFLPLMLYVAWRIWREDGFPVIFSQLRVAENQGEFNFLKFRSMVKNADSILDTWKETQSSEWHEYVRHNFKLINDSRLLKVGVWIRKNSIDELPQLLNVIRGDMSLVGPRPLLARELDYYGDSIYFYRRTKPGLTGLWQISGRSSTQFLDRAYLDEWYIRNWSLWYDIAILFKTLNVVFARKGAY